MTLPKWTYLAFAAGFVGINVFVQAIMFYQYPFQLLDHNGTVIGKDCYRICQNCTVPLSMCTIRRCYYQADLIVDYLGSNWTFTSDCSYEINQTVWLALRDGKPNDIDKNRNYNLSTLILLFSSMPVVILFTALLIWLYKNH